MRRPKAPFDAHVDAVRRVGVFAVDNCGNRVFVRAGSEGYWPLDTYSPEAWQALHDQQPPAVTESALAASLFGWHTPAAWPAEQWATGNQILDRLADMRLEGEDLDGEPYHQEPDDAVETLARLIADARRARD